jgi:hypothetical protein
MVVSGLAIKAKLTEERIGLGEDKNGLPTPRARFHPPHTSSNAMIPRSFIMPPPSLEPCRTWPSSLANSSIHRRSSFIMSRVTGALDICNPSWDNDERMNVASSGSVEGDMGEEARERGDCVDAAAEAAVSFSFNSAASRTMSLAFTMSASRSCRASIIPVWRL